MSKRILTILQYGFFLGLGVFLVWWSVRDLNTEQIKEIKEALKSMNYWLVPPVFLLLWFSHYARGLRWKLLIDSLGYKVQRKNTFFGVLIGYFTNQAVPRLGEVTKCTILSQYEKVPVEKLIGTIILERVIDAICLLMIFLITLVIQPHLYTEIIDTLFKSKPAADGHEDNTGKIIFYSVLGFAVLGFIIWMIIKKKNLNDIKQLVKQALKNMWQGLSAIQHLKKRGEFIILTLVIWIVYLMGGYIGFQAFKQTQGYGVPEAFTVLSTGSIGMIVTPGGIGAYPLMVQQGMMLYGLDKAIALAYGWALWLAQVVTTSIGGIASFIAMPLLNKKKTSQ